MGEHEVLAVADGNLRMKRPQPLPEPSKLFLWTVLAVVFGLSVAALAALLVAFISYGWLPWAIPPAGASGDASFIEPAKVGLTVAAGVGGAVALVVAFRRQQILELDEEGQRAREAAPLAVDAAEREKERDRRRAEWDQKKVEQASLSNRLQRYGEAAKQLGAPDPTVRLAGVYSLTNLADEWLERG